MRNSKGKLTLSFSIQQDVGRRVQTYKNKHDEGCSAGTDNKYELLAKGKDSSWNLRHVANLHLYFVNF